MKVIETYANVMNKAINAGLLTNEDLKKSPLLCDEYWLAAYEVAKLIITLNYSKTVFFRALSGNEYEDCVHILTVALYDKFETQIRAILNPRKDGAGNPLPHNYNAYVTSIFLSSLRDELAKYVVKVKETVIDPETNKEHHILVPKTYTDDEGNVLKLYYTLVSIFTPCSNDDPSYTLCDTLVSEEDTPEERVLKKAEARDERQKELQLLWSLSKEKKYKACIYTHITDKLMEAELPCSLHSMLAIFNNIESKTSSFQLVSKKALIKAYNQDLVTYLQLLSETEYLNERSVELLRKLSATSFGDFGRSFILNDETIYHRRREAKLAVAKILGIEVPKKFKKDSSSAKNK